MHRPAVPFPTPVLVHEPRRLEYPWGAEALTFGCLTKVGTGHFMQPNSLDFGLAQQWRTLELQLADAKQALLGHQKQELVGIIEAYYEVCLLQVQGLLCLPLLTTIALDSNTCLECFAHTSIGVCVERMYRNWTKFIIMLPCKLLLCPWSMCMVNILASVLLNIACPAHACLAHAYLLKCIQKCTGKTVLLLAKTQWPFARLCFKAHVLVVICDTTLPDTYSRRMMTHQSHTSCRMQVPMKTRESQAIMCLCCDSKPKQPGQHGCHHLLLQCSQCNYG